MYQHTVPTFIRMLGSLKTIVKKAETFAETKKFDTTVLLNSRLAPDMYNFTKQVQVATDMAKGCAARLTGVEPPKYEDNEKTIQEVYQRIDKTIAYLSTFKPEAFKGCEDRRVMMPWAPGKYMMGAEYADEMALPNFYFHVSMAYALLRHNGVDLSKGDFIGAANVRG